MILFIVISSKGGPYLFPYFPGADYVEMAQHNGATIVEEVCVPESPCSNFTVFPTGYGGITILQDGNIRLQMQNKEIFNVLLGELGEGDEPDSACKEVKFPFTLGSISKWQRKGGVEPPPR